MRLNSCSLDAITLNGVRCGRNVAALVLELHPSGPSGVAAGVGRTGALRDTWNLPRPTEVEQDVLSFEQPTITVTATILGATGTDSQDVSTVQADFVSVTGFAVSGTSEPIEQVTQVPSVNITNFRIK